MLYHISMKRTFYDEESDIHLSPFETFIYNLKHASIPVKRLVVSGSEW